MLLHPDGSEEVLVDCDVCSVTDPFVSFDGEWIFYSLFHDLSPSQLNGQRDDLPARARTYLAAQDGVKVADAQRAEEPGDVITYEVELATLLKEWDCIFNHEGHLLSRTRDGSPLEE